MKKMWTARLLAAVLAMQCVLPVWAGGADEKKEEPIYVFVELEGECLAESGFPLDSLQATQLREENLAGHETVLESIASLMGEEVTADYRYVTLFNGFSVSLPENLIDEVEALDGVVSVFPAERFCAPESTVMTSAGDLSAVSPVDLVGAREAWEMGYDGAGIVVAVIDTGLDTDHPAFAADLEEERLGLTFEEVAAVLPRLNAAGGYYGLRAEDVYLNNKLPFVFNYVGRMPEVGHTMEDDPGHGTHVAAIVAGNDPETTHAVGMAPKAQIVAMKVMGGYQNYIYEDVLVAALEDAVLLGCDIINMSFGSPAGFAQGENPLVERAVTRAIEVGAVVCAAAGNDFSASYDSEGRMPSSSEIDVGNVSSPGSLTGVFAVAAAAGSSYYTEGFWVGAGDGDAVFAEYADSDESFGLERFSGLEQRVWEYVMVPGLGNKEDVSGLDLAGKIAVIARGELTFAEKAANAFDAGAAAVVIYNNTDQPVSMLLSDLTGVYTAPCVLVSRESGKLLADLAGRDGVGSITVEPEPQLTCGGDGWVPTEYSSWGSLGNLLLKPEVTGVGDVVYSALDGGGYGLLSGTSMAAPQVSGAAALLLQRLKETALPEGMNARTMAMTLLMNTARQAVQENGAPYSPRKQGVGLIRVADAVTTPVWLRVKGNELPKAELGADMQKSGAYTFTFTAFNGGDEDAVYLLSATVLTDEVVGGTLALNTCELDADVAFGADEGMLSHLYDLDRNGKIDLADVREFYAHAERGDFVGKAAWYDLTGDGVVTGWDASLLQLTLEGEREAADLERMLLTVPAGEEAEVSVSVSLTKSSKYLLDAVFEHGAFVEGYVNLEAGDERSADLSVPMLAFYGDWSRAPLFASEMRLLSPTDVALGADVSNAVTVWTGGNSYLGVNPVTGETGKIAVLNAFGGEGGVIADLSFGLLRNAETVDVEFLDQEGNVLSSARASCVSRSSYSEDASGKLPVVWSEHSYNFGGFVPGDYGLGDGDRFTLRVSGDKEARGAFRQEEFTVDAYVDGTAPEIRWLGVQCWDDVEESFVVHMMVRDDICVAGVLLMDAEGETVLARYGVEQTVQGVISGISIDATEYVSLAGGSFTVGVVDLAQNVTTQRVEIVPNHRPG